MIRPILASAACLISVGFSTLALAAGNATAPITDVTLFPGGATVIRSVQVGAGTMQTVIYGLPSRFDLKTLHAEAGSGIQVSEIVSSEQAQPDAVNPAEADLEARITALEDQLEVLNNEAKSAQMVIDYLTRLGGDDAKDSLSRRPAAPDASALNGLVTSMVTESGRAFATIRRLTPAQRDLIKKIDALKTDLQHILTGAKDTRTLTLTTIAAKAGVVKLSYQIANAGWKPTYRARLDSETSTVELERDAIISQKTGEDWTNVRMTLSTVQPLQRTEGAQPQPWLLTYVPPVSDASVNGKIAATASFDRAYAAPAAAPPAKIGGLGAEGYQAPSFVSVGAYDTQIRVPAQTNLLSDGREVSITLSTQSIRAKQFVQIAPRLDTIGYVIADAAKPEGDWPAGNVQVFRDGGYVGSSFLNLASSDRFTLGFGRDAQIDVKVVQGKNDTSSQGVFEKRQQRKATMEFDIANRHARPISVLVLDASPVATSDEIRVRTVFDPTPSQTSWQDHRGVAAWEITIPANDAAKIKTDYEYDYPKEGFVR